VRRGTGSRLALVGRAVAPIKFEREAPAQVASEIVALGTSGRPVEGPRLGRSLLMACAKRAHKAR
jgi:hypothetical protein